MTNRDVHNPEFIRKTIEFYDCVSNYYKISDINKLKEDLKKPDIDLVCFYELDVLRKHAREYHGLNYNDFIKMHPHDEQALLHKIGH